MLRHTENAVFRLDPLMIKWKLQFSSENHLQIPFPLPFSSSSLKQGHFAEVCTNEAVVTNAFISFGYVFFKYLPMLIAIDDCMYIWILDGFHRVMIEHWIVTKNCIKLLHLMREHIDTLCYTTNTIYRYGTIGAICIYIYEKLRLDTLTAIWRNMLRHDSQNY